MMNQRCYVERNCSYRNYGARGISICHQWRNDPEQFFVWAMANGYRDDLTIERMDNDGNYEPSNCTWIPKADQSKNRRKPKSTPPKVSPWSGPGVSPLDWCIAMFGGVSPLAEAIGITHGAVSQWRSTRKIPSVHHYTLLDVAKKRNIDITADDLINGHKFK